MANDWAEVPLGGEPLSDLSGRTLMRARRSIGLIFQQSNLIGPAGFISMEDGAVGGFVQRGIAGAAGLEAVIEMGGSGAQSSDGRATETSVRGFWKAYRQHMGV